MSLNGTSGNIHSPGFRPTGGQYGAYQRCTYDVTVPGGVPVTVRFDSMKVHESDEIVVSEAASDQFRVLITPSPNFQGNNQGVTACIYFHAPQIIIITVVVVFIIIVIHTKLRSWHCIIFIYFLGPPD